jgi:N-acyl homoserine lactone hydrolase
MKKHIPSRAVDLDRRHLLLSGMAAVAMSALAGCSTRPANQVQLRRATKIAGPRLFGCVCGHFESPAALLGLRGTRVRAPVPFYVIEHSKGIALFDCGLQAALTDPQDTFYQLLAAADTHIELQPQELAPARLERLEIDPKKVRWIVVSHLHFDHVGGLHQFPNSTTVVQRKEWQTGLDDKLAARYFMQRRFYDLGQPVMQIDGLYDLFGDQSVVCTPSPGHTPGHQ